MVSACGLTVIAMHNARVKWMERKWLHFSIKIWIQVKCLAHPYVCVCVACLCNVHFACNFAIFQFSGNGLKPPKFRREIRLFSLYTLLTAAGTRCMCVIRYVQCKDEKKKRNSFNFLWLNDMHHIQMRKFTWYGKSKLKRKKGLSTRSLLRNIQLTKLFQLKAFSYMTI